MKLSYLVSSRWLKITKADPCMSGQPSQADVRIWAFYAMWAVRHWDRVLRRLCNCHNWGYSKLNRRRPQNAKLSPFRVGFGTSRDHLGCSEMLCALPELL